MNEKIITFRFTTLRQLMNIVDIKKLDNDSKFDQWFNYKYNIAEEENLFLKKIVKKHKLFLNSYNEQTLSMRFISPLLNKIDFEINNYKDWYEYKIECELNGYILKGEPDLLVAKGIELHESPFFFLQEYKKSINPAGNTQYQVLA